MNNSDLQDKTENNKSLKTPTNTHSSKKSKVKQQWAQEDDNELITIILPIIDPKN